MRLETDLTIRGARQVRTSQATMIKRITLMRVLNLTKFENLPPNNSLEFQPLQVWTWMWAIFLIQSVIFLYDFLKKSSISKEQLFKLNFPQTPLL
jgi:hypothetical protein